MELLTGAGDYSDPDETGATYLEHLRSADLSVGTYSLRAGAVDHQKPHHEDEIYVVSRGRGRFTGGETTIEVVAGTVILVPAGEPHRFHDIAEDLAVLVVFGPAEGTRRS